MARRMLRLELCAIEAATCGGNSKFSFVAIFLSNSARTYSLGAGTRIYKQRDLSGMMTLERLSQLAIIRHVGMYVSIVRRKLAWAVYDN